VAEKKLPGSKIMDLKSLLGENNVATDKPIMIIGDSFSKTERIAFLQDGIAELCDENQNAAKVAQTVLSRPTVTQHDEKQEMPKTGFAKRAFDIAFAGTFLLVASPVLAVIALLIRLDSKGPIIYKSKRVGRGYQVFDFLKFRTMKVNADHLVKDMKELNQYQSEAQAEAFQSAKTNEQLIDAMGNPIDEETFLAQKKANQAGAFFKVMNDPRITPIGKFLRATSLDELPQFVNVLRGDMSIIGNRPLPLYEAEQLTTDQWAGRFLAPAGITGLWQVEKRGKADMSETERKELDNHYMRKQSFLFDMTILARTVPALMQKENV
jgi:lipopolysaccharide/colanic/teichoic acid biosynthesis glycosyltransferase